MNAFSSEDARILAQIVSPTDYPRYLRTTIVVLMTIACFSTRGFSENGAESSASLEKTLTWLYEMVNNNREPFEVTQSPKESFTYELELASVSDGKLRYMETYVTDKVGFTFPSDKGAVRGWWTMTTVPLNSIDPETVRVVEERGVWAVRFNTSHGRKTIQQVGSVQTLTERFNENGFLFKNKELATRVGDAVKHIVILSGGKVDPF